MRARPIHTVRASHSLGGVLVLRVNGSGGFKAKGLVGHRSTGLRMSRPKRAQSARIEASALCVLIYCVAVYYKLIAVCLLQADTRWGETWHGGMPNFTPHRCNGKGVGPQN